MKKIILFSTLVLALNSCSIYKSYERSEEITADGVYRDVATDTITNDTTNFGDLPWRELFRDPLLQGLIEEGLANNVDLQTAILRVDQASAQLLSAKLSYLPSLNLTPQISVTGDDGTTIAQSYEIPVSASWEIDLFGNLLNAHRGAKATLLQQEAYKQAVQSSLVASIANSYYTLLMLDRQIEIADETVVIWRDQVNTLTTMQAVGMATSADVAQARASYVSTEATLVDLQRQCRETENALCVLLGKAPQRLERGRLEDQQLPEQVEVGVPALMLSNRPDVMQAEMQLASAYYTTNQARAAFYPKLTLTGSAGWVDGLGQVVTNPAGWILSAVASLTQPIFNRGQLISNLRVSKDEEQIALLNYKQSILEAGKEVSDALYAAETADRMLQLRTQQCDELEKAVLSSEALFRVGDASYIELLTARQSLLSAQLSEVAEAVTRMQSVVTLYNALGGGRTDN